MRTIKKVRVRKPLDEIMYKPIADFRDYIDREKLTSEHLWIPMGVDANNKLIEVDLIQTPNIWVRGKTGTGKTEWLRSAVKSLLWRYSEEDVVVNVIAEHQPSFAEFGDRVERDELGLYNERVNFGDDKERSRIVYIFDNAIDKNIIERCRLYGRQDKMHVIVATQSAQVSDLKMERSFFPVIVNLEGIGDINFSVSGCGWIGVKGLYYSNEQFSQVMELSREISSYLRSFSINANFFAADYIDKYAMKGDWGSVVEFLKSFTETFDGCRLFLNSVAEEIEKITKESN